MGALLERPSNNEREEDINMQNILQGPEIQLDLPDIALGQWIFESLNSLPPDFTMLIESDTGKTFTAADMVKSSAGVAQGLNDLGFQKDDHVAVIGDNTIALCVSGIGSLFLGAVMCPIDPTFKSQEFQHTLGIIQPKVIIADTAVIQEVTDALEKLGLDVPIVVVDAETESRFLKLESLIQDVSIDNFYPATIDDPKNDLAFILWSSGTTGMPKGVGLSHFALMFQTQACNNIWPPGILMHTSDFYWLTGVMMLIETATNGVPRLLVRKAVPLMILQAIDTYKPCMGWMYPALLADVLNHPHINRFDLSSMKGVIVGGAPLNKAIVDKYREILPAAMIKQIYGCSEIGGIATQTNQSTDILSIGHIIDRESGNTLGPGKEGELLIKAPSLMKGYIGNEKATAEAVDEDGWYHTGDIAKYTEEKALYITGRAKELIIVDGFGISPEEIEAVIAGVEGVLDAVVAGITVGENILPMALVIKHPEASVTEEQIIRIVEENLSKSKQIRAGVHFVDFIPRTSTGKVKRRALQSLANAIYSNPENLSN